MTFTAIFSAEVHEKRRRIPCGPSAAVCLQEASQQHDPGVRVVSLWFRFASFEVKTGDSLQFWMSSPSRYLVFISVIFGLGDWNQRK